MATGALSAHMPPRTAPAGLPAPHMHGSVTERVPHGGGNAGVGSNRPRRSGGSVTLSGSFTSLLPPHLSRFRPAAGVAAAAAPATCGAASSRGAFSLWAATPAAAAAAPSAAAAAATAGRSGVAGGRRASGRGALLVARATGGGGGGGARQRLVYPCSECGTKHYKYQSRCDRCRKVYTLPQSGVPEAPVPPPSNGGGGAGQQAVEQVEREVAAAAAAAARSGGRPFPPSSYSSSSSPASAASGSFPAGVTMSRGWVANANAGGGGGGGAGDDEADVPLSLRALAARGGAGRERRIPLSGRTGAEVQRVLGGGVVPGSLVLIGGDPGIGKSTLTLQISAMMAHPELDFDALERRRHGDTISGSDDEGDDDIGIDIGNNNNNDNGHQNGYGSGGYGEGESPSSGGGAFPGEGGRADWEGAQEQLLQRRWSPAKRPAAGGGGGWLPRDAAETDGGAVLYDGSSGGQNGVPGFGHTASSAGGGGGAAAAVDGMYEQDGVYGLYDEDAHAAQYPGYGSAAADPYGWGPPGVGGDDGTDGRGGAVGSGGGGAPAAVAPPPPPPLAAAMAAPPGRMVLYVTAEETRQQVADRARRMGLDACERVLVLSQSEMGAICRAVLEIRPDALVLDSINTVYLRTLNHAPGGVSQVRECGLSLLRLAKEHRVAVFVIGHVTKQGELAGPNMLAHMVDTALYLEGDVGQSVRLLRVLKNRHGDEAECGVFSMDRTGLHAVANQSALFLENRLAEAEADGEEGKMASSVVGVTQQGSRAVLVEVQALVSPLGERAAAAASVMSYRSATGADKVRLATLCAVLDKTVPTLDLVNCSVMVNVVGGAQVREPANDLAIAVAIASSYYNTAVPRDLALCGEVDLSGRVRNVRRLGVRVREAAKLGFTRVVVPAGNKEETEWLTRDPQLRAAGVALLPVRRVGDALALALGPEVLDHRPPHIKPPRRGKPPPGTGPPGSRFRRKGPHRGGGSRHELDFDGDGDGDGGGGGGSAWAEEDEDEAGEAGGLQRQIRSLRGLATAGGGVDAAYAAAATAPPAPPPRGVRRRRPEPAGAVVPLRDVAHAPGSYPSGELPEVVGDGGGGGLGWGGGDGVGEGGGYEDEDVEAEFEDEERQEEEGEGEGEDVSLLQRRRARTQRPRRAGR